VVPEEDDLLDVGCEAADDLRLEDLGGLLHERPRGLPGWRRRGGWLVGVLGNDGGKARALSCTGSPLAQWNWKRLLAGQGLVVTNVIKLLASCSLRLEQSLLTLRERTVVWLGRPEGRPRAQRRAAPPAGEPGWRHTPSSSALWGGREGRWKAGLGSREVDRCGSKAFAYANRWGICLDQGKSQSLSYSVRI